MKKLTILLSMVLLITPLMACSQNGPAKPATKAETKAEKPVDIPAPTPAVETAPAGISGKVVETMNAAGYTYVYVDNGTEKIWAAAPEFSVKVGDDVMVPEGMAMHNYHSQSLDRDFDVVYFVESVLNASNPTMGHSSAMGGAMGSSAGGDMKIPAGHPAIGGSKAPEDVDLTSVKKADGGKTIAEIYAEKADLSGKSVTLRGKVVKFSPQIMGTNWLHLQDGSGDLKTGNHDLTVTSNVQVKVGDTVLVTGVLTLDKDFGYGYKYDLIMENADVTVE